MQHMHNTQAQVFILWDVLPGLANNIHGHVDIVTLSIHTILGYIIMFVHTQSDSLSQQKRIINDIA